MQIARGPFNRSSNAVKQILGYLLLSLYLPFIATADNWPQWRGPDGNGVASGGPYPIDLSPAQNLAWKVSLPSHGASTPIVWENNIILTTTIDGRNGVLCLDRTGSERWRTRLGRADKPRHKVASGTNSSPVTDGSTIVVYFKSGTLAALDFSGKILWKENLQERFGENTLWWDLGTSPVIISGLAIIAVMQEGPSYLLAFDIKTGELAWKQPRNFDCARESDQSYTTPVLLSSETGADRFIVWGADHVTCHLATTGERLWTCNGFNPRNRPMWRTIASPAVWQDIAVIPYGRGGNLRAIRLSDSDSSHNREVWHRDDLGSDVPTPVSENGNLYLLKDTGDVIALDIKTGKTLWTSDLGRGHGKFYASPTLASGNLYCVSDRGTVVAGSVTDAFSSARISHLNELIIASPVAVDELLLVRGDRHLYCFKQP